MEVELKKKPKKPIMVEGFPGLGLVGTIATEFLIEHLKAKPIGNMWSNDLPPIIAVHDSKPVQPLGIFYDEKHNIVILHAVSGVQGMEWDIANEIVKIAKELDAYEIISLESIGTMEEKEEIKSYFYTTDEKKAEKFKESKAEQLTEGIVIGVTGALLLKVETPFSSIFAETHSTLPDSKAAAKIIEVLNHYLNLEIDVQPLLDSAEKFEKKIRNILEQSKAASDQVKEKGLHYIG